MSLRKSSRVPPVRARIRLPSPLPSSSTPEEDVLRLDGAGSEPADFGASVEEDPKRS